MFTEAVEPEFLISPLSFFVVCKGIFSSAFIAIDIDDHRRLLCYLPQEHLLF